jgi:hypothetical protein
LKDIPGFEGRYMVSDEGFILNLRTGTPLEPRCDRDGYRQVNLWNPETKRYTTVKVHRVVALAFIGEPPAGKPRVDHRRGLAAGDAVGNLRWASASENTLNRHAPARGASGELGVCLRKHRGNPWQAYTAAGGRFKTIGHFATKAEAVTARRNYMEQHHG